MESEIAKCAAELFSGKNWEELNDKEKSLVKLLVRDGHLDPPNGFDGKDAAEFYARKDWHKLSQTERDLIDRLEKLGFLVPNEPRNGYVGKAT
jgi:hypothetical protein